MFQQDGDVLTAGVLNAAIGVMDRQELACASTLHSL
jgi:hypothetical protein